MDIHRAIAPRAPTYDHPPSPHTVQFYEDDAFIVGTVANFVKAGLIEGDGIVVIATESHRRSVELQLENAGLDLRGAHRARYVALDAADTLASLLVDGRLQTDRFDDVIGDLIRRVTKAHGRVRAFGEMVALLWAQDRREAALELERLWNELGATVPFSLLCGYPISAFDDHADRDGLLAVCRSHSRACPTETYGALRTDDERLRAITELQHNGRALQAEAAARHAAQKALERSEHELADFFDNGPVPLHWVGGDGTILRANRAELDLLGYTAEEYIGHHISEFHVDQPVVDEMLARLTCGETLNGFEARVRCRDGAIKCVRIDSNAYFEGNAFVHTRCVTRDVTHEKYAAEVTARLAAIVESSDDAIVSKTLEGIVTSWNRGAERIFRYTAAEMIGRSITTLFPADRQNEEPSILERIRRGERIEHYETERVRKDGRRIHVSITVSPIVDATGRIIGASKIARDVSDRRQAEETRLRLLESERQARAAAEAAMRTKDEFLSVVSHELRTPLASILGWVNVLKSGATGDKVHRAVESIERSGRAQAKLIEDLLDVSRVITGKMRLDLRLVDLPAAMRQAAEVISPTASAKGVELLVHIDEDAGPVAGDLDRLQQIAWNLLSNAVKFTPSGGTVELCLERRDDDACLIVRDTGRGITRDLLPFIFERFRQADQADSRRHGGLGLGLAIVRHLVELHGGGVAVASDGEGCGATFTVKLPLPTGGGRESEVPARLLAGLRVLVVDDDFDVLDGLRIVLEGQGARVTVAGSMREACDLLRESAPDVAISDIRLRDADGYALVRELRASDRLRKIPAIAITGLDSDNRVERATEAGFDLCLGKPVDSGTLVNAIFSLVTKNTARERN